MKNWWKSLDEFDRYAIAFVGINLIVFAIVIWLGLGWRDLMNEHERILKENYKAKYGVYPW